MQNHLTTQFFERISSKKIMEVGGSTWVPRIIQFTGLYGVLMINEEKSLAEADIQAMAAYLSAKSISSEFRD
ncbi:hypothetical protein [Polynucleobacter arcticus]|uniref:Uncharacterized protein n=1 Tax=Polynucleobacter arcticus TaxID=1743165 RepID=A0A6M9PI90_9BURK|nr:hypothetical protein [Polynucleobacter arcticus]QKM60139.1 hypothetical protein DN92_03260 [Polynucleobacter arcticus]